MNFLNIGMKFDGNRGWSLEEVILALRHHNIEFIAIEEQWPVGGEPTAVVTVGDEPLCYSVLMLAKTLHQDCIAMWGATYPGDLIGARAAMWLPFNAELFLLPKVVEKHIIDRLA